MSRTILYKTDVNGKAEVAAEFQNATRGALFVWEALGRHYLRPLPELWNPLSNPQPVWDLWKDPRITETDKIVLLSTFDRVMVKREHLPVVADAFRQFDKDHARGFYTRFTDFEKMFLDIVGRRDAESSLTEQSAVLDLLALQESCYAVFWNQTSVTDAWVKSVSDDESRLYDITRDTGHWFMFADESEDQTSERIE